LRVYFERGVDLSVEKVGEDDIIIRLFDHLSSTLFVRLLLALSQTTCVPLCQGVHLCRASYAALSQTPCVALCRKTRTPTWTDRGRFQRVSDEKVGEDDIIIRLFDHLSNYLRQTSCAPAPTWRGPTCDSHGFRNHSQHRNHGSQTPSVSLLSDPCTSLFVRRRLALSPLIRAHR
jgi:hypothetical protein